ncbi:atp-binding transport protein [Pyrococcus sp. NA2]|uniref:ATP-binding cassette domain-containing protein n=1 Tax=Pyrococcus sp. (strain NA2) TaxID=342949 RepID=UPI000209ABC7|nr:ATP-binding cassette domain-containing protein [Pyrococcus sp. NA2]AEC51502.1 atp-binding transport protein [Pyrococcus sp. NA2]
MSGRLAIKAINLEKDYGRIIALKGISFDVKEGEIFGLIGPNDAGKSTTLRILATLLKPSAGRAEVYGHDVVKEAKEVGKLISYLPEEAGAYKNLTGYEYLEFMAKLYSKTERSVDKMLKLGVEIEVEFLCDRVALINRGIIVEVGTPKELKERYNAENLEEVFMKAVAKMEVKF